MSTGHASLFDDEIPLGTSTRLRALRARHPELYSILDKDRGPNSHSFDIPWVAGRNREGTKGYISRTVSLMRPLTGSDGTKRKVWIVPFLMTHEFTEWFLMHRLGYGYEEAHHLATAAEREAVESAGFTWESYRNELRRDIRADSEHEPTLTPRDLDLRPYIDAGSKALLRRIVNARKGERKGASRLFSKRPSTKSTKDAAEYIEPSLTWRKCRICTMFEPPASCSSVLGRISPRGYCRYFEARQGASPNQKENYHEASHNNPQVSRGEKA